jgi:trans-aconitate methyltransferase
VLDIGCGNSLVLNHLQRQYPECHYIGIDIDKWALQEGASSGFSSLRGNALCLPLRPSSIDLILTTNIFTDPGAEQWIEQMDNFAEEVTSVLKPGGIYAAIVPFNWFPWKSLYIESGFCEVTIHDYVTSLEYCG